MDNDVTLTMHPDGSIESAQFGLAFLYSWEAGVYPTVASFQSAMDGTVAWLDSGPAALGGNAWRSTT